MIKNKFLLYLLCGVMFSPALAFGECKPTQDCRALGYKEAPCPEQGVKCPFGETWYCPLLCKDGQVWENGKCTVKRPKCQIGWVYYSDNTCSADVDKNKKPIGVVVYVNPNGSGGQALSLVYPGSGRLHRKADVAALPNISSVSEAQKDFNSCSNTKELLAIPIEGADHINNYAPSSAPETKGKWCIPAAGVAYSILNNFEIINNAMEEIDQKSSVYAQTLVSPYISYSTVWTSTEFSSSNMWVLQPMDQSIGNVSKSVFYGYYRPVIEF